MRGIIQKIGNSYFVDGFPVGYSGYYRIIKEELKVGQEVEYKIFEIGWPKNYKVIQIN